ncbi:MAG TPA: hypothetical protein VD866_21030, partial [Urbifossiella sp.]|nr:hypothetical protein [Urbifossiella sp.]
AAFGDELIGLSAGGADASLAPAVSDGLLVLASVALDVDNPREAARLLAALDGSFPDRDERVPLRRELLARLRDRPDPAAYVTQAGALLADPLVRWPDAEADLREVLATAYTLTDRAACAGLVEAAHPSLLAAPPLQAVRTLCHCPDSFDTPDEALKWAGRLWALDLGFSPRLRADQFVQTARAAEHGGDGPAAAEAARLALEAQPDDPRAQYWAARTRLYLPPTAIPAALQRVPFGKTPEWQRLKLLTLLYKTPDLAAARAALPALAGTPGRPDDCERALALRLLQPAVGFDPKLPPADAKARGDVARQLRELVGPVPWVELAIADAEIRADRDYPAAATRLAAPAVAELPLARSLGWLARMAGMKPQPGDLAPSSAGRALAELDSRCGTWVERIAARWEWLRQLLESDDREALRAQAGAFLSDPLVDSGLEKSPALSKAVGQILAGLYQKVSPAACAEVAAAAGPAVRQRPEVRAAIALGNCPPRFTSPATAAAWASRVPADALEFDPLMTADAHLVAARAAEWAGDWAAMEARARAARDANPGYAAAAYWLARARLRTPGADVRTDLQAPGLPAAGEWARLRRMADVAADPTAANVEALLDAAEQHPEFLDPPEQAQAAALAAPVLTASLDWPPDDLTRRAGRCRAAERAFGPQSWAAFTLAVEAVRLGGDTVNALRSLDDPAVRSYPDAANWSAAGRILAGTSDPPPDDSGGPFPAAERAVAWLRTGVTRGDPAADAAAIDSLRDGPWGAAVPALAEVAAGLRAARSDPAAWRPGAAAPAWLRWAHARLALVASAGNEGVRERLASDLPEVAAAVGLWQSLYDPGAEVPPPAAGWAARLGPGFAPLAARDESFAAPLAAARRALAAGRARDAERELDELERGVGPSPLQAGVWLPAVRYWRAAALARHDPERAKAELAGLSDGPKAADAAGQAALLAIGEGDLDAAGRLLAGASPRSAGVAYATALLHERRGELPPAREWLARVPAGSSYHRAAVRLLAAVEERHGDAAAAEVSHRQALAAAPSDAIAAARLARGLLRADYEAGLPPRDEVGRLLAGAAREVEWATPFELLFRFLTAPSSARPGLESQALDLVPDPERRRPWIQVLAHRILEWGEPVTAQSALEQCAPFGGTEGHRRSRLILAAWDAARRAWDWPARRAELTTLATDFAGLADGPEIFRRWRVLIGEAARLAGAPADTPVDATAWRPLAPWPFAALPDLWSADAKERGRAAAEVDALLPADGSPWSGPEREALRAVVAAALGKDDDLLAAYAALDPDSADLAVDPAGLWHAVGTVWFRRKNWKALLEGDLPECVADLADPHVRLLIGLAYAASTAAAAAADDIRNAVQKAKQARATLEVLVDG